MTLEAILGAHFARYPSMQIQDVYKLVHQAAMGSEHAIPDPDSARKWMEQELTEMGTGLDEPMLDPISADEQIVRVHLRPFVAQGGEPEPLLNAFIRTASEFRGNLRTLKKYWDIAAGMGYYSVVEMDDFIRSMQSKDYPSVHHSSEYNHLYRPAYRVVCRRFIS